MSIKYFPSRVFKGSVPAIDRVMAKRKPVLVRGTQNTTSNAISDVISATTDWQINSIQFTFSSNTYPISYSAKVLGGVKVLTNLNDYLWFQTPNSTGRKITLDQGFYTGTQLAAQLQTKLNADAGFTALGLTFTVVYDSVAGTFTITPSWGTVRYWQTNMSQVASNRDSIAGHLFGLTANTSFAASITSDSTVYGLDQEAWIIEEDNSVVFSHYNDDIHIFELDQALQITTNTAPMIVSYQVCYEEIV